MQKRIMQIVQILLGVLFAKERTRKVEEPEAVKDSAGGGWCGAVEECGLDRYKFVRSRASLPSCCCFYPVPIFRPHFRPQRE